jgi:5-methylcytosine-specific restriction endonuclease McrA
MKLLNELPELEEKISTGDISLTHLGLAQALFNSEEKVTKAAFTHEQKLNVFDQIAKKSVREAEKITLSLSSAPAELKPDLIKVISADKVEFRFTATTSTKEKIEKLKGFLAHTSPNISLGELLEKLCDLGLEEWDPAKGPAAWRKRCVKRSSPKVEEQVSLETIKSCEVRQNCAENHDGICKNEGAESLTNETASPSGKAKNSDSKISTSKASASPSGTSNIGDSKTNTQKTTTAKTTSKPDTSPKKKPSAAQTRREVFARAGSACENCGSTFALEIDHIYPKALGGSSEAENLRVLCRACNQRAAIQVFGMTKMGSYLEDGF